MEAEKNKFEELKALEAMIKAINARFQSLLNDDGAVNRESELALEKLDETLFWIKRYKEKVYAKYFHRV